MSVATLINLRAEHGLSTEREWSVLPAWQMRARFEDLANLCPDRIEFGPYPRRGNHLNMEPMTPTPRCALLSPDGRGLAWIWSGGSPVAYGKCCLGSCQRAQTPGAPR